MKRFVCTFALLSVLVTGCCFGDPEQGEICFVVIPIPGGQMVTPGGDPAVQAGDCSWQAPEAPSVDAPAP